MVKLQTNNLVLKKSTFMRRKAQKGKRAEYQQYNKFPYSKREK